MHFCIKTFYLFYVKTFLHLQIHFATKDFLFVLPSSEQHFKAEEGRRPARDLHSEIIYITRPLKRNDIFSLHDLGLLNLKPLLTLELNFELTKVV